jgi:adenosine/AMP kinase
LVELAQKNALKIAAGHVFILFLGNAFPLNVLRVLRDVPEMVRFFCATANPYRCDRRDRARPRCARVVDGESPLGVRTRKKRRSVKVFAPDRLQT